MRQGNRAGSTKKVWPETRSPKQARVSGGWGNFKITHMNVTLIQNVLGKHIYIYIEVPTNISERVQLTFKVTFIYRKFVNLYTNKYILHK